MEEGEVYKIEMTPFHMKKKKKGAPDKDRDIEQ